MAYLIVNDLEGLYKIAENDTDLNSLNVCFPPYTTIDISDSDFLKIKQDLVDVNISNGSATFTDRDFTPYLIEVNEVLLPHHKNIIESCKIFLDKNPSNAFYTKCQNYYNYLKTLDYSSLPSSIDKTWEHYCQENSIAYIHPLQIP